MPPDRPLVSIIVPSYNGARFLRESLDAILGQRDQSIEVIVMDDASTDDTPGILGYRQERYRNTSRG